MDVPDYANKDKFRIENLLIGQFMSHITSGPKVSNTSKSTLKVILIIFRKKREFQRLTAGPRLFLDKLNDSEKIWENFYHGTHTVINFLLLRRESYWFNKIFSLIRPQSAFYQHQQHRYLILVNNRAATNC